MLYFFLYGTSDVPVDIKRYLLDNFYTIKFSKPAEKDKIKLKNANLDKSCKNILNFMLEDSFCYPPSYEKLILTTIFYMFERLMKKKYDILFVNKCKANGK